MMHVMDIQFSSLYLDSLLWSGRSTERILSGLVVFTSSPKYDHYIFLSSPTHSFSPESVCSLFTRLRNIYSLLCSLCRLVAQTLTQNGGRFLRWLGKKKTQTASLVPFKCPFGFGEKQNEILMVMLRVQKSDWKWYPIRRLVLWPNSGEIKLNQNLLWLVL